MKIEAIAIPLMLIGLATSAATAAEQLPGGATSLRESYGDWVLNCAVPPKTDTTPSPVVTCAVSQELIQQQSRRRALVIALAPTADGAIRGSVIMPFGLALSKGVQFQIDDGPQTEATPFRTCTPQGCIVPVDWTAQTVASLRVGNVLKLAAITDAGQPAQFSLSLKGFSAGYDRSSELTR